MSIILKILKYAAYGIVAYYLICGIAFPVFIIGSAGVIMLFCIVFLYKYVFLLCKFMIKIATFGMIDI